MNIGFLGLGKLGLPCALAISSKGHNVYGYDTNNDVKTYIDNKKIPYREEHVDELLQKYTVTVTDIDDVVDNCDIIFVPIQTPHEYKYEGCTRIPEDRDDFNYDWLKQGITQLSESINLQTKDKVVIIISTVLPGTIEREIMPIIKDNEKFKLCYNPFFIAMGTTVNDFLNPEFVLFGVYDEYAAKTAEDFYKTIHNKPFYKTDIINAELIKVCYNTFIGMKIVFSNTIMEICHKVGADVDQVIGGIKLGTDRIISTKYLSGGMGDGGGCLLPSGLIHTSNGIREIEDVKISDKVLTHDGTFKDVIDTYQRPYKGKVLKITVRGLGSEIFTPEHPFLVSKDLRKKYITNGIKKTVNSGNIINKLGEIEELNADCLTTDHYMLFPENIKYDNFDVDVSDDYLRLSGYYLAEGSNWLRKDRKNKPSRVEFSFHKKETDYINEVIVLAKKLYPSCNPTIIPDKDSLGVSVRINSVELCGKLYDDFGKNSNKKIIPKWLFSLSPIKIGYVLRGMFRGDGMNNKNGFFYSTTSKQLAYGSYLMLKKCNIISTLQTYKPRTGKDGTLHQTAYEVRVRNANYVGLLSDIIEMENLHQMQNKRYTTMPIKNENVYHKIEKIEELDYDGLVYNLNIDENHTYVTGIGTVHNCHPRDNIAMSWLAKKLNLSHNFFEDIMEAREDQTEFLADLIMKQEEPYYILGKTFKEETNLIIGSPSILLKNILEERGVNVIDYDPFIDENDVDFKKGTYFVATRHNYFKHFNFPKGSTVIDVWRFLNFDESDEITHIKVGIKNK